MPDIERSATVYAQELLNCAAVHARSVDLSGVINQFDDGVMQAAASIIAADRGGTSSELIAMARVRAQDVSDWRREHALYKNLLKRFV